MKPFLRLAVFIFPFALLAACDDEPEQTSAPAEPGGFPKRYDVEVSESDGLTRLKGETEPFSGQVVMRNKEWKM
ncbi:MAG: hypothetical protein HKN23_06610, partial [Verrucomicrobiales bacterium]|nr:hypothetical protein [Verrucomicrobiales bacterium]